MHNDRESVIDQSGNPTDYLKMSVRRALSEIDFVKSWDVESYWRQELILRFHVSGPLNEDDAELLEIATSEIIADFRDMNRIDHVVVLD